MKKSCSRLAAALIILSAVGIGPLTRTPSALAQAFGGGRHQPAPLRPDEVFPRVRFSGTIYPFSEGKSTANPHVLRLQGQDLRYLFEVDKAEDLTGTRSSIYILERIPLSTLRVRGPEELMDLLRQDPQGAPRPITLEGLLNTSSGILDVTSVG
ncbi:MAG: hypothetical protein AB1640_02160 [bacterium]